MLFYSGKRKQKMFFVKEHHLQLFRDKGILLNHLDLLPFYDVSKEDLLDWLSLQLSVEKSLFGQMYTTYDFSGGNKFVSSNAKVDLSLLTKEIEQRKDSIESYGKIDFSSFYNVEGACIIYIGEENDVKPTGFNLISNNLSRTIYSALSNVLGFHGLYYKDFKPEEANDGIDLSQLLRIICR